MLFLPCTAQNNSEGAALLTPKVCWDAAMLFRDPQLISSTWCSSGAKQDRLAQQPAESTKRPRQRETAPASTPGFGLWKAGDVLVIPRRMPKFYSRPAELWLWASLFRGRDSRVTEAPWDFSSYPSPCCLWDFSTHLLPERSSPWVSADCWFHSNQSAAMSRVWNSASLDWTHLLYCMDCCSKWRVYSKKGALGIHHGAVKSMAWFCGLILLYRVGITALNVLLHI